MSRNGNELRDILIHNMSKVAKAGESYDTCARWIHNDLDAVGFLNTRNHVREYKALLAAMEHIDPATIPGLTVDQRVALARFAKPARADSAPSGVTEAGLRGLVRWAHDNLYEITPDGADDPDEINKLNDASVTVILGLALALGENHGRSDEFWAIYKKENPRVVELLSTIKEPHPLSDAAIAEFWPDVITEQSREELRNDFDALMAKMYAFEPQQWMGPDDLLRKRWHSHSGAMNLIRDVLTVTTLSYEECALIYARGRGFIRDNAPLMSSPVTGEKYQDKEGNRHVQKD